MMRRRLGRINFLFATDTCLSHSRHDVMIQ